MNRPLLTPQNSPLIVAYDSSAQSSALATTTKFVRLASTTGCWIAIGSNPSATVGAGSIFIPANMPVWFGGALAGKKIAAIKDTTAGNLSITQGDQF